MATSPAARTASKLLNLSTSGLQNFLRPSSVSAACAATHLFQSNPAATAAIPDSRLLNLFHLENGSADSLKHSSGARNLNLYECKFPLNFQRPMGSSAAQIEAARTSVPSNAKDEPYRDFDVDGSITSDEDDEDVEDYVSDIDDLDEEYDDDEDLDEEPDARPPPRRYKK